MKPHDARLPAIALTVVAAALALPVAPATAFEGTATLPLPGRHNASEPHLAVNPTNGDNVVVVSRDDLPAVGLVAVQSWRSLDGGASWTRTPIVSGRYEGKAADASDPVVAFGPAGSAVFGGLAFTYSRRAWQSLVVTATSTDGGRTFTDPSALVRTRHGPPIPPALGEFSPRQSWNDKEWIAVDTSGGPFSGTMYLAWVRIRGRTAQLLFSRLAAGAQSLAPALRIERGGVNPQIAVRPNGVVDLLWTRFPGGDRRSFQIRHAASADGGASFVAGQTVATLRRTDVDPVPTLATDGTGRLLACWSRENAGRQRALIQCSRSADGLTWSAVSNADPGAPRRVQQLLPAVASQGTRFWLMGYLQSLRRTEVALYRSDDGGATFTKHATLAERNYGTYDSGFVGDYMGLAATPDHVLAAYVLSRRRALDRQRVYVTSLATP